MYFFFFILPPIIFESGYTLNNVRFFGNFGVITLFAVVGTVISTVVFGTLLYLIAQDGKFGVDFTVLECFIFAALISAVDPVATLAIVRKSGADINLFNIIFGESLLNDAVAVVLYRTFLKIFICSILYL